MGIRFMRAYADAVSQYEEGKTPANVAILAKRVHLDESLVQAACWPAIRPNLAVERTGVQPFVDWAWANGELDQQIDMTTYVMIPSLPPSPRKQGQQ